MQITWYGNASIIISDGTAHIGFDPFLGLFSAQHRPKPTDFPPLSDIFITHGHLDHLSSVPRLLPYMASEARVHCTDTPAELLREQGIDEQKIAPLVPGDAVSIGAIQVEALPGAHIHFDRHLIVSSVISPRVIRYFYNLPRLGKMARRYHENEETVTYLITCENRTVLLLGSLALAEHTSYPSPDLLVLPFQGRSDVLLHALALVQQIRPRAILLDHFDDAFPPASRKNDPMQFVETMSKEAPDVPVIVPHFMQPITL